MGWFWADKATTSRPPYPTSKSDATPPPGCPMHSTSHSDLFPPRATSSSPPSSSCPVLSPNEPIPSTTNPPSTSSPSPSYISALNPLNYMPSQISQTPTSPHQRTPLPTTRETSSIPRGDVAQNWEYPSPQQMYNALLRKGYTDTPEDAIESMVRCHNFLNEGAWAEIVDWEARFAHGLAYGWQACRRGEAGFYESPPPPPNTTTTTDNEPKLLRFHGRPNDLTPKARAFSILGQIYPSRFSSAPPFDRHDWYILRGNQGQENQAPVVNQPQGKEIRYIIDYYAGPPESTGEPVFYLDVRPAIDGPVAACERMMRWGGDIWWRASGGRAREAAAGGG